MFATAASTSAATSPTRPTPSGLLNQNWKDSDGAVCFADGTQATGSIAVAEAQGYAYDALRRPRTARPHRVGRPGVGGRARRRTPRPCASGSTRDFWMPEHDLLRPRPRRRGTPGRRARLGRRPSAVVRHPRRRPRTSRRPTAAGARLLLRLGHPYARRGPGPVPPAVVPPRQHLAARQRRDHPRPGPPRPARRGRRPSTAALVEAAARHGDRLPEVIAGYTRQEDEGPVPYPHACSPQAWAAATPLALLTAAGARAET